MKISDGIVKLNKRDVVKGFCTKRYRRKEGPCKSCKFRDEMDSSCIFEVMPKDWR